jgi:hypothetical protein
MMVFASGITSSETGTQAGWPAQSQSIRAPGVRKCLVVSGDESLRSRFEAVTELSGWSACDAPIDVADVDAAVDGDYQLVVVDIARPLGRRVNDSIEVAEEFAGRPGSLLVICGSEDSAEEELWARQLGAWVYLPGVASGDTLVSLCADARRLSERRGAWEYV